MLKCKDALENDKPINQVVLSDEERQELRHITFLTEKPMIIVVNVDEDQLKENSFPAKADVLKYTAERGIPCLEICAKVEAELRELSPEDAALFMEDLGITEPGINRLAQVVYEKLGLISFLTAGEDEVRAWTIRKGLNAKQAAGKIHSDIERGFIRAEVVAFNDLKEHGSMAKVKEKGLARLEGKDYIVEDGDIINFRFNV
jgi:GTP-binding protein YchF